MQIKRKNGKTFFLEFETMVLKQAMILWQGMAEKDLQLIFNS